MFEKNLIIWIEATICVAFAIVLSFLPTHVGSSFSISFGMIPIILYSFRRGVSSGLIAGFLWGIMHFLIGNVEILNLVQAFIEYFIAFIFVGFSGMFSLKIQSSIVSKQHVKSIIYVLLGTLLGVSSRFFWHFIAGFYFWGSYAPKGMSAIWFSFIMNGGSALATVIVVSFVLVTLLITAPQLFVPYDMKFMKKIIKTN